MMELVLQFLKGVGFGLFVVSTWLGIAWGAIIILQLGPDKTGVAILIATISVGCGALATIK